ncbi:MAG: energy transducer TonB [Oceanicaulis sp.]
MKLKLIAICMALACAPAAAAQDLPQDVMDAYGRYMDQVEAGDLEGARAAAADAFAAGEAHAIAPATLAVLAHNYATMSVSAGDQTRAAEMFTRAARLYESAGEDPLVVARADRLAVEAMFVDGEAEAAEARADEVADHLETLPASPEHSFELARLRGVQAHALWNKSQPQRAGQRGREAFEHHQASGEPTNGDVAFFAYYAGIQQAFAQRNDTAAYWFAVADYLFEAHEVGDHAATVAYAWGHYARGRLDDTERRRLIRDLAEGGWAADPCAEPCAQSDEADEPEFVEDENNREAEPIRRDPPFYPRRMARYGVQGIALVQFDVDEAGRTDDIELIFAAPHGDFGEAGVEAVADWRYRPRIENGVAVRREDVVTQLFYELTD